MKGERDGEVKQPKSIFNIAIFKLKKETLAAQKETFPIKQTIKLYESLIEEYLDKVGIYPVDFDTNRSKYTDVGKSSYSNNVSVKQAEFPNYNAVAITDFNNRYFRKFVIAEGPMGKHLEHMKKNLNTFFQEILFDNKIDVFFAVGDPQYGIKYTDYFSRSFKSFDFIKSESISAEMFFKAKTGKDFKFSENPGFRFYELAVTIDNKIQTAYVMHVPNWPDQDLPTFNPGDMEVLLYLAKYVPKLVAHCSAGMGRSPTLLAILMGYIHGLCDDENSFIGKLEEVIRWQKNVKPGAIFETCQCLCIGPMVEYLQHLVEYLQHLATSQLEHVGLESADQPALNKRPAPNVDVTDASKEEAPSSPPLLWDCSPRHGGSEGEEGSDEKPALVPRQ